MGEWVSERASEWVSEWVSEWMSEWVSECVTFFSSFPNLQKPHTIFTIDTVKKV